MRLVAKQGHILKKYKDSEQIFEAVGLSKSTAQVYQQVSCIGKGGTIVTLF